jgi:ankyrin repeat protein
VGLAVAGGGQSWAQGRADGIRAPGLSEQDRARLPDDAEFHELMGAVRLLAQGQLDREATMLKASAQGYTAVVRFMLGERARLDARGAAGRTAMHVAAANGHCETLGLLVRAGASMNVRDEFGMTPLHLAALAGKADTVDTLLFHGLDARAADDAGLTPLHAACLTGSVRMVAALLKKGADPLAADAYGRAPLDLAPPGEARRQVETALANGPEPAAAQEVRSAVAAFVGALERGDVEELRRWLASEDGARVSGPLPAAKLDCRILGLTIRPEGARVPAVVRVEGVAGAPLTLGFAIDLKLMDRKWAVSSVRIRSSAEPAVSPEAWPTGAAESAAAAERGSAATTEAERIRQVEADLVQLRLAARAAVPSQYRAMERVRSEYRGLAEQLDGAAAAAAPVHWSAHWRCLVGGQDISEECAEVASGLRARAERAAAREVIDQKLRAEGLKFTIPADEPEQKPLEFDQRFGSLEHLRLVVERVYQPLLAAGERWTREGPQLEAELARLRQESGAGAAGP